MKDSSFKDHQGSILKLVFLGLFRTWEKNYKSFIDWKWLNHPFLAIFKLSRFWKNKRRPAGFEPATYSWNLTKISTTPSGIPYDANQIKKVTLEFLSRNDDTGWQFHNGRYKLIFPISITLKMSL